MKINIVNHSRHPLPEYATSLSAGVDLHANIEVPVLLQPLERKLIPTGLFIELPAGFEAQIRPRSGLAIKKGITVLNSPGTIDADYRGEICVILVNLSTEDFIINDGDCHPCKGRMDGSGGAHRNIPRSRRIRFYRKTLIN